MYIIAKWAFTPKLTFKINRAKICMLRPAKLKIKGRVGFEKKGGTIEWLAAGEEICDHITMQTTLRYTDNFNKNKKRRE